MKLFGFVCAAAAVPKMDPMVGRKGATHCIAASLRFGLVVKAGARAKIFSNSSFSTPNTSVSTGVDQTSSGLELGGRTGAPAALTALDIDSGTVSGADCGTESMSGEWPSEVRFPGVTEVRFP